MREYIYVAQHEGFCKIGMSANPSDRVKQLASIHKTELDLIYIGKSFFQSARSIERLVHQDLEMLNIKNLSLGGLKAGREWFEFDEEMIVDSISRICDDYIKYDDPYDVIDFMDKDQPTDFIRVSSKTQGMMKSIMEDSGIRDSDVFIMNCIRKSVMYDTIIKDYQRAEALRGL